MDASLILMGRTRKGLGDVTMALGHWKPLLSGAHPNVTIMPGKGHRARE